MSDSCTSFSFKVVLSGNKFAQVWLVLSAAEFSDVYSEGIKLKVVGKGNSIDEAQEVSMLG